jgi:lysozyme
MPDGPQPAQRIEPLAIPASGKGKAAVGGAAAGGAVVTALALMLQLTPPWENTKLDPYKDPIGKWTVCTGETEVPMQHYTLAQCNAISARRFKEFLDYTASITPGLSDYPFMHAAFGDMAYNNGKGAYASSGMRREFANGNYRKACRIILQYKFAGGKVLPGLALRRTGDDARIGDYEMCLGDAVRAELTAKGTI